MNRENVIRLIWSLSRNTDAFSHLERAFANLRRQELSLSLIECGAIPERFGQNSSEEKLWSKYCDILLAHTWSHLGIPAQVIRTRGDSADVLGIAKTYSIVGDAKAFRLSRTAKNQKDFKVVSLDDWRKMNTYASLVGPLYQFPKRTSQIYRQAIDRNVTLISYTHLRFLLDHYSGHDLEPLWNVCGQLQGSKDAISYWEVIDRTVCEVIRQPRASLEKYKAQTVSKASELGEEGIAYWKEKITEFERLSQQEAVARLIKAEKIDAKIRVIRKIVAEPLPDSQ